MCAERHTASSGNMDPVYIRLTHDTMLNQLSIPIMPIAKEHKYVKASDEQLKIKAASEFNPIEIS